MRQLRRNEHKSKINKGKVKMTDKERIKVMRGLATCRVKLNRFCERYVSRKTVDQDAIMMVRQLASQSRSTFRELPLSESIISKGSLEEKLSKYMVKKIKRTDSTNYVLEIGRTEMLVKVIEVGDSEVVIPWWFRNAESKGKKLPFDRQMAEAINSWLKSRKS